MITGCASKQWKLYDQNSFDVNSLVKIINCDGSCEDQVEMQLGFDDRYQINKGLLLEVDGKRGDWEVRHGKAFNSSMHGGLNVEVMHGEHELVIDPNSYFLYFSKPERFKVELIGGHTYSVGRVRIELMKNQSYRWFPIVYDVTSKEVIYANDTFFSDSAKMTCMRRKKDIKYCDCFVGTLIEELSFKQKEEVIMNGTQSAGLIFEIMQEHEDEIEHCAK